MAIRGQTDGGSCGDKEIRAPNLLPCKSYVELNSGKNAMCIFRRLTLPFISH